MPRELIVYGGTSFLRKDEDKAPEFAAFLTKNYWQAQTRVIVAARSKAEAARLLGFTPGHAKNYMGATGNTRELEIALAEPGKVFWRPLNYYGDTYLPRNEEV